MFHVLGEPTSPAWVLKRVPRVETTKPRQQWDPLPHMPVVRLYLFPLICQFIAQRAGVALFYEVDLFTFVP